MKINAEEEKIKMIGYIYKEFFGGYADEIKDSLADLGIKLPWDSLRSGMDHVLFMYYTYALDYIIKQLNFNAYKGDVSNIKEDLEKYVGKLKMDFIETMRNHPFTYLAKQNPVQEKRM